MPALQDWLDAIEEDYKTFTTLPLPFSGNGYCAILPPITEWNDATFETLVNLKPCASFQDLRAQIDDELAEFDVAPDYSDLLRQIEDHHGWARRKFNDVKLSDPNRLSYIENVHQDWQEVVRYCDLLQTFTFPFGHAEGARAGRKQAEFFTSFYEKFIELCGWLGRFEEKATAYRRIRRENANRIKAARSKRMPGVEIISDSEEDNPYVYSPDGDAKNYALKIDVMERLEIRARHLGMIVSLRFPSLADQLTLINSVPTIPIKDWRVDEKFPYETLYSKLKLVEREAQRQRLKANSLKDAVVVPVNQATLATALPKEPLKTVSESFKDIVGRFIEAGRVYGDLHLAAVYGGVAYDTWPEIPKSDEAMIGLWPQDWHKLLRTDGNIFAPLIDWWVCVDNKLWQAGFYNAGKLWPVDDGSEQFRHFMAGINEFEKLATLATNHFGILPKLLSPNPEWSSDFLKPNAPYRWLETLLSDSEQYQEDAPPNDLVTRYLTGNVFIASAQAMERMEGKADIKESIPENRDLPKRNRVGRPKTETSTQKWDEKIYNDWQRARETGVYKPDFAKGIKMEVDELDQLLDRVSARKRRSDKLA